MQQEQVQDLVGRLNAGDRELYEERAAVREFDGLQPRALAEALALLDVLRLRPAALLGVQVVSVEIEGDRRCALLGYTLLASRQVPAEPRCRNTGIPGAIRRRPCPSRCAVPDRLTDSTR